MVKNGLCHCWFGGVEGAPWVMVESEGGSRRRKRNLVALRRNGLGLW